MATTEETLAVRSWSVGASERVAGRVSFVIANKAGDFCFSLLSDSEALQLAGDLIAAAQDAATHEVEGETR